MESLNDTGNSLLQNTQPAIQTPKKGINLAGVQFQKAGKVYDYICDHFDVKIGDHVVVETDRGQALAQVVQLKYFAKDSDPSREFKAIQRKASEQDVQKEGRLDPEKARSYTSGKARDLNLNMRVLKADVQFGGNKVIIYFSAPGRVDFRELVKELAHGLRTRVELKQVGARDETKVLGGVGVCGREYCCSSFLREFVPVSIRMAKNQNLALNPTKVSGGCGRLLCCLTYENDVYTELRQKLPPRGARIRTTEGLEGVVINNDFLNQLVTVENSSGQTQKVPVSMLTVVDSRSAEPDEFDSDWGENIDFDALAAMEDEGAGGGEDRPKKGGGRRPPPRRR